MCITSASYDSVTGNGHSIHCANRAYIAMRNHNEKVLKILFTQRRNCVYGLAVYLFFFSLTERATTLHGNFLGESALVVEVDNYSVCPSVAGFASGLVLRVAFLAILPVTCLPTGILRGML